MFDVRDMPIFEVNNPGYVAEPRASVMNASFAPRNAEDLRRSGPRVRLTVGGREYLMNVELAKTLAEEMRVAVALGELAQTEYLDMLQKFVGSVAMNVNEG